MSDRVTLLFQGAMDKDRAREGDEALQLLETLQQYEPGHRLGLFYRGAIKIRYRDDVHGALQDWEQAFAGADPGAAARVEEHYKAMVEVSIQRFAHCTTVNPDDPGPHAAFAQACHFFGRSEQAQRHLRRAFDLDRTRWTDALLLYRLLMDQNEKEDALAVLQKVVEANAEVAVAHFTLGRHYHASESTALAVRHLETAAKLEATLTECKQLLGDIYLSQGRYEPAAVQFQEILKGAPSAAAHLGMAECVKQQYDFEKALTHYRQAVELEPTNFRALSDLGALALQFGDLDLGVSALLRALQIEPGHPDIYVNLAKAAQQKGDTLEAISALRQVLTLDPHDGFACFSLATQLRSMGDYKESSTLLVKALQTRPGDVQMSLDLADCYVQTGRTAEGLEVLRLAFQRNPAHQGLREALTKLAPTTSAQMTQQSRGPSLEDLVNLGRAHLSAGRQDEALESYRAALAMRGSHGESLLQVGRIYASRNMTEPAADLLQNCYAGDPTQLDVLLELFKLLDKLLDFERREILTTLAKIMPKDIRQVPWLERLWSERRTPGIWQPMHTLMDLMPAQLPPGHPIIQQWLKLQTTPE